MHYVFLKTIKAPKVWDRYKINESDKKRQTYTQLDFFIQSFGFDTDNPLLDTILGVFNMPLTVLSRCQIQNWDSLTLLIKDPAPLSFLDSAIYIWKGFFYISSAFIIEGRLFHKVLHCALKTDKF